MSRRRPYFFWDYDVTEEDIINILKGTDVDKKCWVAARILEYALWNDIWKYLSVPMIAELLPYIKMRTKDKELWEYAINRWQHES
jgi:hypothetical protein